MKTADLIAKITTANVLKQQLKSVMKVSASLRLSECKLSQRQSTSTASEYIKSQKKMNNIQVANKA
jgi:regulator of replication initiation timing